jgi:hypothetical protein
MATVAAVTAAGPGTVIAMPEAAEAGVGAIKPLEAKGLVEARVSRNPYLKVGKVTENENGFEVQVVTKEGEQLVNRLQVEKDTGRVYRVFE